MIRKILILILSFSKTFISFSQKGTDYRDNDFLPYKQLIMLVNKAIEKKYNNIYVSNYKYDKEKDSLILDNRFYDIISFHIKDDTLYIKYCSYIKPEISFIKNFKIDKFNNLVYRSNDMYSTSQKIKKHGNISKYKYENNLLKEEICLITNYSQPEIDSTYIFRYKYKKGKLHKTLLMDSKQNVVRKYKSTYSKDGTICTKNEVFPRKINKVEILEYNKQGNIDAVKDYQGKGIYFKYDTLDTEKILISVYLDEKGKDIARTFLYENGLLVSKTSYAGETVYFKEVYSYSYKEIE